MSKDKDETAKTYAEIWGEAIHSNRHLRVLTMGLAGLCLLMLVVIIRLSSVEPPRPIVVRVDEVGRAEALAYETVEARADPLDPTTKYFLNRFIDDYYSRRRATVEQAWARSLRFLTTGLANEAFRNEGQNVAMLAAGASRDERQVERVVLRVQAKPTGTPRRDRRLRPRSHGERGRDRARTLDCFPSIHVPGNDPARVDGFQSDGNHHQLPARRPGFSHRRVEMIEHLREREKALEPFRLERPRGGMGRPGLSPQRRVH